MSAAVLAQALVQYRDLIDDFNSGSAFRSTGRRTPVDQGQRYSAMRWLAVAGTMKITSSMRARAGSGRLLAKTQEMASEMLICRSRWADNAATPSP